MELWGGVTQWTFYNVILPVCIPIFLVWAGLWALDKKKTPIEIVSDGQLCFFSIALIAVNHSEIENIASDKRPVNFEKILHFITPSAFLMMIIIVFIFGLTTMSDNANNTAKTRLSIASIFMTVASLIFIYYWRNQLGLFT